MIAYVEVIAWIFGRFLKVVDQKYEDLLLHGCRALSEEFA
jgi:hypothetical protein